LRKGSFSYLYCTHFLYFSFVFVFRPKIDNKIDNKSDYEIKKTLLRDKIKNMYKTRTNINYHKAKNNKNIPENILNEYKKLVKISKIPVLEPNEVLENVDKYKPLISMMISNEITNKISSSHPYMKYYKLLADKIGAEPILPIPTKDYLNNSANLVNIQGNEINKNEETDSENEVNM
jgi:hypothetical protein